MDDLQLSVTTVWLQRAINQKLKLTPKYHMLQLQEQYITNAQGDRLAVILAYCR